MNSWPRFVCQFMLAGSLLLVIAAVEAHGETAWRRHTIDDSSRGADGVRVADVNGDGLLDVTTGWEEGGVIRVYWNPGPQRAQHRWPSVNIGSVKSPEDAVFVDLDDDGGTDVVSCCEGKNRTVYVHWAPQNPQAYLKSDSWSTRAISCTRSQQSWMFALPLQVDGQHGIDLITGSKGNAASVGWLQSPENPRDLDGWRFHRLYDAGWIMSLVGSDLDNDGDVDVIVSDRKGNQRGVLWLENPGPTAAAQLAIWKEHRIGASNREVMFLDVHDLDGDGRREVVAAVKPAEVWYFKQRAGPRALWEAHTIQLPAERVGTAKSVRASDVDLDGRLDLVFSCEQASSPRSGVVWLRYDRALTDREWVLHEVSGPKGVKYDLIQMLDLDADGDADVLTCEERSNLGVFWYENPIR